MKLQMIAPMHFQWYGELIDKVFGKVGPTEPSLTSLIVKSQLELLQELFLGTFH